MKPYDKKYCCADMAYSINEASIVHYNEVFDEYGVLLPEDSVSFLLLRFCPWCGKRLPLSRREDWFEELEALGYEASLLNDEIPARFKTAQWRAAK